MAEEQDPTELNSDEAKELERLLEEERAGEDLDPNAPFWKKWLFKLKANKKLALLVGTSFVLVIGLGVGAYILYFKPTDELPLAQLPPDEEAPTEETPEKKTALIEEPNVYTLKPFFLPLREKGRETGKFMNVTVNLLLSNQKLDKDIDKIRPLIRQNIYTILQRRKLRDLRVPPDRMQESLKREMLTASNSLLLSGTGTITDIFFTEFIVSQS